MDIIPYSDIQSQLLCFFFIISLQHNVKISVLVKYRKSIEIASKSTPYRYRIFRRYRYFKIDPIPDTSSTRYRFRPIPNNYSIVTSIYALGAWVPAYVTRENFENVMQFGTFWCIFDQIVS